MPKVPKIYESPDGGHTVYERSIGESQRRMVKQDTHARNELWKKQIWRKWMPIIESGEHDPILQDMINQVEEYWKLKHG